MSNDTKKILIAEDDPVSCRVLLTMLEKWGHEVLVADDGIEALELYESNKDIHFIISDWMMPNLDGLGLCERIREITDRPYTYFILLTAKSQTEDLVKGMEAGADDFITKPLNHHELKARLKAGERILSLENELAVRIHEISEANMQINRDLNAAATTLSAMMPKQTGRFPRIEYASVFRPCDLIGGDFFNIVKLDETHIGIYILDVSGHGVPAALQAVSVGRLLSPYDTNTGLLIKENGNADGNLIVDPNEVINALNSWFGFTESGGKFITILYGVLDTEAGTFRFSRAGHPLPIHISNGELTEVPETDGIPVGIIPDSDYTEAEIQLVSGDRIYFYTDGLPEAHSESKEQFTDTRVREFLLEHYQQPVEDGIAGLVEKVLTWSDGAGVTDDISILGLEYSDG